MKKKKIECVIFDWAGTTIDYGCFAPMDTFIDVFKTKGVEVTEEEARKPMGMMKRDHIKALLEMKRVKNSWKEKFGKYPNEDDIDELYGSFEPNLLKILPDYCEPIPGALELVKRLRDNNIKIGSTTGYVTSMMAIVKKGAKKNGYAPDNIVNSAQVKRGRPYPYMIWKNAMDLDVDDLSKIVKVGDTIADVKEGVNAGVWSVGVIIGSSELGLKPEEAKEMSKKELQERMEVVKSKFKKAGAHYVIDNVGDLDEIIEKINKKLSKGKTPKDN